MSNFHKEGSIVFWSWYGKKIKGTVQEVYCSPVAKQIKTAKVKRNASEKNPAYYIKGDNGNYVLKLHSELVS